jgi:hypothetical protein
MGDTNYLKNYRGFADFLLFISPKVSRKIVKNHIILTKNSKKLPEIRRKTIFKRKFRFLKFFAFLLVIPPPPPCYNVIYLKEGPPVPVDF